MLDQKPVVFNLVSGSCYGHEWLLTINSELEEAALGFTIGGRG